MVDDQRGKGFTKPSFMKGGKGFEGIMAKCFLPAVAPHVFEIWHQIEPFYSF